MLWIILGFFMLLSWLVSSRLKKKFKKASIRLQTKVQQQQGLRRDRPETPGARILSSLESPRSGE